MNSETKQCQNCKKEFVVEPDDFSFYEKMQVPPPVNCPDCRFMWRALFRNEMHLYSRKCALCGKAIVAMYHPDSPYTVYCRECWLSEKWDPFSYGQDYDQKRPFFEQMGELMRRVPRAGIFASEDMGKIINSEYINFAGSSKDCYFVFNSSPNIENCSYSRGLSYCRDVFDSYFTEKTERAYESVNVHTGSGAVWSQNSSNCIDSWYLLNCSDCQSCFGCVNLRHKSFHFLNEPLSKSEYERRVSEIKGSYEKMEAFRKQFEEFSLRFPRRENNNLKSMGATGDYIFESKNCRDSSEISFCENSRFLFFVKEAKDCYDLIGHGRKGELLLEGVAVGTSQNVIGSWWVITSHDIAYSFCLRDSEHCFGCDGIRNGQYVILNKKYSKKEYEAIRAKIIAELKSKNLYGSYFPPSIALFAYNETIGQDYLPLTKDEAIKFGFRWEDNLQMTKGKETLKPQEIPDHIKDAPDSITKEVLSCVLCQRNYKITEAELGFYKRMMLPIPRLCFFCRHTDRIKRKGTLALYDGKCDKCGKGIRTNYAPDHKEIVYCESCYQAEVL